MDHFCIIVIVNQALMLLRVHFARGHRKQQWNCFFLLSRAETMMSGEGGVYIVNEGGNIFAGGTKWQLERKTWKNVCEKLCY